jgi:metal-responsive CopG/Arc/MetJ family transcriptional regulator
MADDKDKGSDGKVTISIRLPAELVEVVDKKANEELRSRSAQIQRILEESTADKKQPAGKK